VLIAVFVALGAWKLGAGCAHRRRRRPSTGAFAVSLVWISFAYSGWNAATYVAGEVRDPERNLPRALLLGTGIVTVAYLALNAVFVWSAPLPELAGKAEVGAIAAEALGGPGLRRFLALIVSLALLTSVSSLVMSGPRVYARMAEDGLFPRPASRSRSRVRSVAAAIAVVWVSELESLIGTIGFTLGLCAAGTVGGLVRLRLREGAERVPIPGWPVVPALYVALTLFASVYLALRKPESAATGVELLAVGLVLYLVRRRA
jgi:APA family basic amino acid/polyamine antiporter